MQMLLPFMMTPAYASLHKQTLHRQWKGLLCIGLFMVRCTAWHGAAHESISQQNILCWQAMRTELCCVTWQAMNIALNNLSLVRICLSLNQVIRWVTPPIDCTQMHAAGNPL
jgi:hypothetical protein